MRTANYAITLVASALLQVPSYASDVTAARTLRVGSVVEKTDLKLNGDHADNVASELIGKEIKRAIYVGRAITKSDVGPITVVDRNDVVQLSYQYNGLWIRTEARALEPGGLGEEITVMNLGTRISVRARITGSRRARVVR